ncbi:MAG: hypothetical protein MOB07_00805 [Acidobacteria bacterium]|nr:hypothetical protein [Acidobacteriota bacterium]
MKIRSRRTKLIATALTIVALAAILATWNARQVDALAEDHNQFVVGLTSGQTARLSALNSGEAKGIIVDYKFFDSQGRVLRVFIAPPDPDRQLIPPGQMRSVDLNADDLNVMRDRFGRIQVHALVRAIGNPDEKNLHASLEVFDNATGKTTVLIQAFGDGH